MRISLKNSGSPSFIVPLACVAALLVAAAAMMVMGGCQSDYTPASEDEVKTPVAPQGPRDARNYPPPSPRN